MVQEEIFTFLPCSVVYIHGEKVGEIKKELTFWKPQFHIDFLGWQIDGDFLEWDYTIRDREGSVIATLYKEVLSWTDTYTLDIMNESDALYV